MNFTFVSCDNLITEYNKHKFKLHPFNKYRKKYICMYFS